MKAFGIWLWKRFPAQMSQKVIHCQEGGVLVRNRVWRVFQLAWIPCNKPCSCEWFLSYAFPPIPSAVVCVPAHHATPQVKLICPQVNTGCILGEVKMLWKKTLPFKNPLKQEKSSKIIPLTWGQCPLTCGQKNNKQTTRHIHTYVYKKKQCGGKRKTKLWGFYHFMTMGVSHNTQT